MIPRTNNLQWKMSRSVTIMTMNNLLSSHLSVYQWNKIRLWCHRSINEGWWRSNIDHFLRSISCQMDVNDGRTTKWINRFSLWASVILLTQFIWNQKKKLSRRHQFYYFVSLIIEYLFCLCSFVRVSSCTKLHMCMYRVAMKRYKKKEMKPVIAYIRR